MLFFLAILFLLVTPFLYARLGGVVISGLRHIHGENLTVQYCSAGMCCCAILLGLELHLVGSFVLLSMGANWTLAVFCPLLLSILPSAVHPLKVVKRVTRRGIAPSFAFWIGAILIFGISLFDTINGIETPWKNNYGDLAYHFGMIHNFSFAALFPPENHLFAGQKLIYPFLINIWSALFWWQSGDYALLKVIFVFQWSLLWIALYKLLRGDRYPLLSWTILLGGGSYLALGMNSGSLISAGYPWTSFLTTIWVTQRAALFGTAIAIGSLSIIFGELRRQIPRKSMISFAGIMLALSPLMHTHIFLIVSLFCLAVLFLRIFFTNTTLSSGTGVFFAFLVPFSINLAFAPLLLGKSHIMQITAGWTPGAKASLLDSMVIWATNAPLIFILGLVLLVLTRKWLVFIPLLGLFLMAHIVQLSFWDWDQIKIFLALYLILIAFWSSLRETKFWHLHLVAFLLCIPSIWEVAAITKEGRQYTVYDKSTIQQAELLRSKLPTDAIILAAPLHNSLATLSGRTLYYGYEGTLASHGIEYSSRKRLLDHYMRGKISYQQLEKPLPTALIWTEVEKKFFSRLTAPEGFKQDPEVGYLYHRKLSGGQAAIAD